MIFNNGVETMRLNATFTQFTLAKPFEGRDPGGGGVQRCRRGFKVHCQTFCHPYNEFGHAVGIHPVTFGTKGSPSFGGHRPLMMRVNIVSVENAIYLQPEYKPHAYLTICVLNQNIEVADLICVCACFSLIRLYVYVYVCLYKTYIVLTAAFCAADILDSNKRKRRPKIKGLGIFDCQPQTSPLVY